MRQIPVEFRAAASPALLERGCVNVIGLEAIRQEEGPRWPQIRDGVYAHLEELLREKLGPTDFFARFDDVSYLVTMPSANPEDVNVVCLRVAYDLFSNFFGQCDIRRIQVSTASNAGENLLALKPLPSGRIDTLVEMAGIQDSNPPDIVISNVSAPSPIVGDRSTAAEDGMQSPAARAAAPIVEHHYIPVWAVPNCAITTYICAPKSILAAEPPKKHIAIAQPTSRERILVELSCLHAGVGQLAKQGRTGERFLLGVAISFDVLGSPAGRMEFLSACHGLSSEYRQHLEFTLTEVPPGVAQTRLNNLVNMLRPFARSVSATVAPGSRDTTAYQGIGLRAIGIGSEEFPNGQQFRLEDAIHLANAARAMRLGTFIYDLKGAEALKYAYAANIQFLSGPAIAPPCDEPRTMSRLTWKEVLQDSFAVA